MKKLVFVSLFFFSLLTSAQGVFFLHGVKVAQKDAKNFEHREVNYLSKLAQDEVDAGRMSAWILLRSVNSIGDPADLKYNYIWVHRFNDITQMANRKPFWENMEAKFGDVSNFIWSSATTTASGRYYWKIESEIAQQEPSKYVILNAAKPTDLNKMVEISSNIANKVFRKNMKKSGLKGWGVATKIAPVNSNSSPNTVFYWDSYDTMEGVMKHLSNEAAMQDIPNEIACEVDSYIPEGWGFRSVWRVLASTTPK